MQKYSVPEGSWRILKTVLDLDKKLIWIDDSPVESNDGFYSIIRGGGIKRAVKSIAAGLRGKEAAQLLQHPVMDKLVGPFFIIYYFL